MNFLKRKHEDVSVAAPWRTSSAADQEATAGPSDRPDKMPRLSSAPEASNIHNSLAVSSPSDQGDEVVVPESITSTSGSDSVTNTAAPSLSARAQKLANIQGEVGSDDKPKGKVRYGLDGNLEYFSEGEKTWVPAVYHNDLRGELIEEAAREGKYVHTREHGLGATDVTSFLESQKSWGPDRKDWPEVLFQTKPDARKDQSKTLPLWKRNGRLLLDHDNHPMREFAGVLPTTYSSRAEGWLMEATYRSDKCIHLKDLRGRMPREMVIERKGQSHTEPLFTLRTISQRTGRFRKNAGLIARHVRGGSDVINAGLQSLLPAECFTENTTKHLNRELTSDEVKAITNPNKGRYPQRGRTQNGASDKTPELARDATKKRKRTDATIEDLQSEGIAKDEERETAKKARYGGVSQTGAPSVLTPNPIYEPYTPALLTSETPSPGPIYGYYTPAASTSESSVQRPLYGYYTPAALASEASNPGPLYGHYTQAVSTSESSIPANTGPTFVRPLEQFNSGDFAQIPGGRSGARQSLESRLRPRHLQTRDTLPASRSQGQRRNAEGGLNLGNSSSEHVQTQQPPVAPYGNFIHEAGTGFTQGSGFSTNVGYYQTQDTPVGVFSQCQGSNGHEYLDQDGDFQQALWNSSQDTAGMRSVQRRNDQEVGPIANGFVEPGLAVPRSGFLTTESQVQDLVPNGIPTTQTAPVPSAVLAYEADGAPIRDSGEPFSFEEYLNSDEDLYPDPEQFGGLYDGGIEPNTQHTNPLNAEAEVTVPGTFPTEGVTEVGQYRNQDLDLFDRLYGSGVGLNTQGQSTLNAEGQATESGAVPREDITDLELEQFLAGYSSPVMRPLE